MRSAAEVAAAVDAPGRVLSAAEQATAGLVRRDSLVVVIEAAEQCAAKHRVDTGRAAELVGAIADLRASLPTGTRFAQHMK